MPKVSPLQSNFSGGEFSPLLYGRVDAERYQSALAVCENYIPTIQGGLIRRSGNYFVAEVKSSSAKTRLVSFEFSTTQAYIIEFGNLYLRFYKDNGQITLASQAISGITNANPAVVTYVGADTYANGDEVYITGIVGAIGTYLNGRNFKVAGVDTGANTFQLTYMDGTNVNSTSMGSYSSAGTIAEVYTVTTTYATADLFQLKFTQSADTLYITHPSYPPKKLTRTAHTTWTITTIDFLDGPYLTTNTTATTLTPSAATGAGVTLTASAVTGINGDAGFATTDVGRLIRIKEGSVWGYVKITGWTSTTVVTVTVINTLTNTGAKTAWRMGLYSDTTGYPGCVTFHEDRLFFAGNTNQPQRLDGSKSGDYENFAPTATDGTIAADNAVSYALNANTVNVIRWMISDEKGLLAGTVGGEWSIRATTTGEALSPTNINAKPATAYGSANIQPVQVGKSAIFVQRAGKKIREMTYFYDVDGFRAPDLTVLSEHITGTGVSEIAYQKEPQSIVWSVRNDGVLVGMTYERDLDSLKVGWSRHVVGGYSDAANSDAVVESVAVIPAADGTRDEVWMIVKRYVNGGVKRYIEYMTAFFEDNIEQKDAFFVDSGLTYDAPLTITGITQANPAVVTSNGHLLSNGNVVLLSGVKGMTEVNGETFTVANAAANTFELTGINSTAYTTYVSGGEIRKYITTVSGLWHLEGQSVSILGDGAVQPNATVANGSVTLTQRATTVQVGLGYNSDGQMLRLEAGSADGTALGKTRRTHRVGILLHRSLGLKIGMSFTDLDTITFRTSSDPLSRAVPLYSGILSENIEANYDFENQFCWRQDQPLPSLILAVAPQMVTMDR
jgi:hypothetical protein